MLSNDVVGAGFKPAQRDSDGTRKGGFETRHYGVAIIEADINNATAQSISQTAMPVQTGIQSLDSRWSLPRAGHGAGKTSFLAYCIIYADVNNTKFCNGASSYTSPRQEEKISVV